MSAPPRTAMGRIVVALGLLVSGLTLAVSSASPASAAAGTILSPFPQGETWRIFQGYSSGTHTGTSAYGLDLTLGTSTTSTAGRTVTAPMAGTIYYWDAPYGNLCINTGNGRSYTMTHINPSKTSGAVAAGESLGTVANAGSRNNNGVAHLHFEFWSGRGCYNQSTPLALSAANGLQMCGAPDLPASGPNGGNGIWSGTTFTSRPCGPASNDPIGAYDTLTSPEPGTVRVSGWALDRDAATTPVQVHVYVGGPAGQGDGTALTANLERTDVGAVHAGTGSHHGYIAVIRTGRTGSVPVYVYAINASGTGGNNVLLGAKSVTVGSADPYGNLDGVTSTVPGTVSVRGWAVDPSSPTTAVTTYATTGAPLGTSGAVRYQVGSASVSRPDVAAAVAGVGDKHGFDRRIRVHRSGTFQVYLYAANLSGSPGKDTLLGTKTVTVLAAPQPMVMTKAPKISGTPRVGRTLRSVAGTWSRAGVTVRYQWLRNSKPLKGARATTYRLKGKDRGARISLRVTATTEGYTTVVTTTAATRRVK